MPYRERAEGLNRNLSLRKRKLQRANLWDRAPSTNSNPGRCRWRLGREERYSSQLERGRGLRRIETNFNYIYLNHQLTGNVRLPLSAKPVFGGTLQKSARLAGRSTGNLIVSVPDVADAPSWFLLG